MAIDVADLVTGITVDEMSRFVSVTEIEGGVKVTFDRGRYLVALWAHLDEKARNPFAEPDETTLGKVGYVIKDGYITPFGFRHSDEIHKMEDVGPDAEELIRHMELLCGSFTAAEHQIEVVAEGLWNAVEPYLEPDSAKVSRSVMPDLEFYNLCVKHLYFRQLAMSSPILARLYVERDPLLGEFNLEELLSIKMDEAFKILVSPKVQFEVVSPGLKKWLKLAAPTDAPITSIHGDRKACWDLAIKVAQNQDILDPNRLAALNGHSQWRLFHTALTVCEPAVAKMILEQPEDGVKMAEKYFSPQLRIRFTTEHSLYRAYCEDLQDYISDEDNEGVGNGLIKVSENAQRWHDAKAGIRNQRKIAGGQMEFPEPPVKMGEFDDFLLCFIGNGKAMRKIGGRLGHCYGSSYYQSYYDQARKGESLLYVLLDKRGTPYGTICVNSNLEIREAKIMNNAPMEQALQNKAKSFLKSMRAPKISKKARVDEYHEDFGVGGL